jgi:hypothetical protein
MKLSVIAQTVVQRAYIKMLTESISGDAASIQKQLFSLGNELKKDGEDVTDEEVQAALLSALIDAEGKVNSIDVSDIDAIKTEIKESRSYLSEAAGILGSIHLIADVLGNAAFLHVLSEALQKAGFKDIDENKLKAKLEKTLSLIKSVTGFPAKVMEKAFAWIASKLGASAAAQKIAGVSGVLLITLALLSVAVYVFPSITSGVLLVFAISGLIGKGVEIVKLTKEIVAHIKENEAKLKIA